MNHYKMKARGVVFIVGGMWGLAFDSLSGTLCSSELARMWKDDDREEAEASFGEFMMVTELVTKVIK